MRKTLLTTCILAAFTGRGQAQVEMPARQDIPRVAASARGTVVLLKTFDRQGFAIGLGSGFRIAGGRYVTNAHVVAGAARVEIFDDSGMLLGIARFADMLSTTVDLAILPSVGPRAPYLALAGVAPAIGEKVIVIGAPEGLTNTVSDGIVSAQRRIGAQQVLQISAPISPGSSGGPVLNTRGEVIGVSESILREGQNLNFAVSVSDVSALVSSHPGQFDFPASTDQASRGSGAQSGPPRSAATSPQLLTVGSAVGGQLTPVDNVPGAGYVDYFRIDGDGGKDVTIDVGSSDFAPFIGVFQIIGDSVITIAIGKELVPGKSAGVSLTVPANVTYMVAVSATADSHSKMGSYTLVVIPRYATTPSSSASDNSRWLDAGSADILDFYFDRTRITRSSYGTHSVWVKGIYHAPYTAKDGETYDATMSQYELSCSETRFRLLSTARYLKDALVSSSDEPTSWHSPLPESVFEHAETVMCDYIKQHGL